MADISKINPNGTEYNLKDEAARADLANKVDKIADKGLSTNDFTNTDKAKLDGIEAGAQVNTVNPDDISSSKTIDFSPSITITDAAPINAEDITVDITPQQDLHGYDRPWAGGGWKNKYIGSPSFDGYTNLNYWTKQTETYNGHEVYKRSGKYNGLYKLVNLPIGTYTFSCAVKTDNGATVSCYLLVNGGVTTATVTPTSSYIRTTTDWTKISLTFEVTAAGTVGPRLESFLNGDIYISEYQLEAGNQATSYADYENICPITGYTDAELDRDGKNLFDGSSRTMAYSSPNFTSSFDSDNNTLTMTGIWYGGWVIRTTPNTDYTFSATFISKTINADLQIYTWDGSNIGTRLGGGNIEIKPTQTFNSGDNEYVAILLYAGTGTSGTTVLKDVQVEEGTTATTYEPYQGEQYTASFGETVYGGKWHVTEGGTDNEMANVDYGDLQWERSTHSSINFYYFSAPKPDIKDAGEVISTVQKGVDAKFTLLNNGDITGNKTSFSVNNHIICRQDEYATADAFKTAMTGQKILYELATPTTISTPKQNVPMLQGINTVSADCGDVSLKYQPDNVIGELKGEIEDIKASAESITITAGDGTNGRTFTFDKRPLSIMVSYGAVGTYLQMFIVWGQSQYAFQAKSTNGQTPSVGLVTVTFDDATNTMTITGSSQYDSIPALNHPGGSGVMVVTYRN